LLKEILMKFQILLQHECSRKSLLSGVCMDIGGTKARIYEFHEGKRFAQLEIELPSVDARITVEENGKRRVDAISRLVKYFGSKRNLPRVATACAGLKDADRTSVTLLHFAVPLPNLTQSVEAATGTCIGPLYDDDVAAAWGHIVSPKSPLGSNELNTLILTAGTGLAEAHWINGEFMDKKSYTRASELGLEQRLRAAAWKDDGNPFEALCELVEARRELYPIEQLILSGRFVHMDRNCLPRLQDALNLKVHLVDLPEAPALGALQLLQASAS
jgi:hypothetical protein